MEDSFKNIIFAFVMITLFSTLLITVIVNSGSNYGKDPNEVTNGALDLNAFNNTLNTFQQNASTWQGSLNQNNSGLLSQAFGTISTATSGISFIANSMVNMVVAPFTLIASIATNVLNVPVFITNTILALVIMACIFGLWRLYKWGS